MTQGEDLPRRRRRRNRRPDAEPAGRPAVSAASEDVSAGPEDVPADSRAVAAQYQAAPADSPAPVVGSGSDPTAARPGAAGTAPPDNAERGDRSGRRDKAERRETANQPDRPDHRNRADHRDDAGRGHGRDSERGWRELAGSAPSQVGLGGALRARDVARPTAEDLAAAERTVVLVRRQWQPPES